MKMPVWTKPALLGAAAGAIGLSIVGFSWFGWVTSSGATDMADRKAVAAITAVLVPYCVESARSDANGEVLMAELSAATGSSQRLIVEKSGWATPLGMDAPNRDLAQACARALVATP